MNMIAELVTRIFELKLIHTLKTDTEKESYDTVSVQQDYEGQNLIKSSI